MNIPFENFGEFLSWLSGPTAGGLIIFAWFISWALDKYEFWKNLSRNTKLAIMWAIAVVLGVGGHLLAQLPNFIEIIDPYFKIVLGVTIAWLSTQVAYEHNPLRKTEREEIEG